MNQTSQTKAAHKLPPSDNTVENNMLFTGMLDGNNNTLATLTRQE